MLVQSVGGKTTLVLAGAGRNATTPPSPAAGPVSATGRPSSGAMPTAEGAKAKSAPSARLWLLVAGAGNLLLFAMSSGFLIYTVSRDRSNTDKRVYDRKELEAELWQATPEKVREKLGNPDSEVHIGRARILTPEEYERAMTEAALNSRMGGPVVWTYHGRSRDPRTGLVDERVEIVIDGGRVASVDFTSGRPVHSIPRPPQNPGGAMPKEALPSPAP
jgi:hypothetical protein